MFGTYADFGGNSVLDYFRPITNETRNHENFALPRYTLGRYFAGECVAVFDLLLEADKRFQKVYQIAGLEINDTYFQLHATAYLTQILLDLREEMVPDTERLALRFCLVGDATVNSPAVVAENRHVIVVYLKNEKADESHYLTFAFTNTLGSDE